MFRKISMMLSLVGVLGLGLAIAIPSPSFAKDPPKHSGKSGGGGNKSAGHKSNVSHKSTVSHKSNVSNKTVHRNVVVHRTVKTNYVYGRRYNGHVWYGQSRHRWHGNWYAYGVGPCWINVEGFWFWNVAACP